MYMDIDPIASLVAHVHGAEFQALCEGSMAGSYMPVAGLTLAYLDSCWKVSCVVFCSCLSFLEGVITAERTLVRWTVALVAGSGLWP